MASPSPTHPASSSTFITLHSQQHLPEEGPPPPVSSPRGCRQHYLCIRWQHRFSQSPANYFPRLVTTHAQIEAPIEDLDGATIFQYPGLVSPLHCLITNLSVGT